MKAYIARLAQHAGGLIRGSELERIASGEFLMLVMMAGGHEVRLL